MTNPNPSWQDDQSYQPKILVVDDNETNVELICMHLKPFPYEVLRAYDGDQALQMIQENSPDLILLDLMMPRISCVYANTNTTSS